MTPALAAPEPEECCGPGLIPARGQEGGLTTAPNGPLVERVSIHAAAATRTLAQERRRYESLTRHLTEAGSARPRFPWAEAPQIGIQNARCAVENHTEAALLVRGGNEALAQVNPMGIAATFSRAALESDCSPNRRDMEPRGGASRRAGCEEMRIEQREQIGRAVDEEDER